MNVKRPMVWVATATALFFLGCGGDEAPQDEDFERHLAKPLPLNKVFTDALSPLGGDKSDWKIFNTTEPGLVTVSIHFDKPDGDCEAQLADKYGAKIEREVQSANPYVRLTRKVEPGRFFVWIYAPKDTCSTQYSIEARLEPD